MSDGQIFKPEKDFTKEADKQIPEAHELAKVIDIAGCFGKSCTDRIKTEQCSRRHRKAHPLRKANKTSAAPLLNAIALFLNVFQASDLASTSRLLVAIVTICKESGDWGLLNEQVLLLSKKHGQLKQATTKMVQVVMASSMMRLMPRRNFLLLRRYGPSLRARYIWH